MNERIINVYKKGEFFIGSSFQENGVKISRKNMDEVVNGVIQKHPERYCSGEELIPTAIIRYFCDKFKK